jgi:hypothetical protein
MKPEDEFKLLGLFKDGTTGFYYDAEENTGTEFKKDGTQIITKDPYGAELKSVKEQLADAQKQNTKLRSDNLILLAGAGKCKEQLAERDKQIVGYRKALEWYGEEAKAISKNLLAKQDNALLASIQVLALDTGHRADEALDAAIDKEIGK